MMQREFVIKRLSFNQDSSFLEDGMQNALARVRNPALRQGIIFGIILGIILLALSFIGFNNFSITFILCLLAAFLAGFRASQETGRMITGTLAGLWAGLIGTFIPSLILMILFLINIDAYRKSAQVIADQKHLHTTYTNSILIEGLLINFVILLFLGVLLGAVGGVVGGQFGRRRATIPPVEEYKETMFEPPATTEVEESTPASEPEEISAPSEAQELPTTSAPEEPLSETPTQEPSS
jgi:Family of unknown function (DUF5518)